MRRRGEGGGIDAHRSDDRLGQGTVARDRVAGLIGDVREAEAAGFASMWIPQVPGYLDALTIIAMLGRRPIVSSWVRRWSRSRPGIRWRWPSRH